MLLTPLTASMVPTICAKAMIESAESIKKCGGAEGSLGEGAGASLGQACHGDGASHGLEPQMLCCVLIEIKRVGHVAPPKATKKEQTAPKRPPGPHLPVSFGGLQMAGGEVRRGKPLRDR